MTSHLQTVNFNSKLLLMYLGRCVRGAGGLRGSPAFSAGVVKSEFLL